MGVPRRGGRGRQQRLIEYGAAALLAILLLLQAAFSSWRLAALLLVTLPTALVGGVIAAWVGLGTITLGALVGFFTVLGIAARNGILLISHFRHLEREEGCRSARAWCCAAPPSGYRRS